MGTSYWYSPNKQDSFLSTLISPRIDKPFESEQIESGIEANERDSGKLGRPSDLLFDFQSLFQKRLFKLLLSLNFATENFHGEAVKSPVFSYFRDELGRFETRCLFEDISVIHDFRDREYAHVRGSADCALVLFDQFTVDLVGPLLGNDHQSQVVQSVGHSVVNVRLHEAARQVEFEVAETVNRQNRERHEHDQPVHVINRQQNVHLVVVGERVSPDRQVHEIQAQIDDVVLHANDNQRSDEQQIRVRSLAYLQSRSL